MALCTGRLDPTKPNDVLFIGSRTNLLAYGILHKGLHTTPLDVDNNRDIFDKEVSDGVSCLAFGGGRQGETSEPDNETTTESLIVAGGNCSITGFDIAGDERFWTVTGDNAATLQYMDWDDDGVDELVVGSDDFSIRVFKGEEMIFDINEQSKI